MKPESRTWLTRAGLALAALAAAGAAWQFARPAADDGAFVQGNGRVEAVEVDVAAKSAGRVAEILVNEGDFVNAGDVIARMDTRAIDAQLARAVAQLANARSARQRRAEPRLPCARARHEHAHPHPAQRPSRRVDPRGTAAHHGG